MYVSAESNSCQKNGGYMDLQALHAGQLHSWTEQIKIKNRRQYVLYPATKKLAPYSDILN